MLNTADTDKQQDLLHIKSLGSSFLDPPEAEHADGRSYDFFEIYVAK